MWHGVHGQVRCLHSSFLIQYWIFPSNFCAISENRAVGPNLLGCLISFLFNFLLQLSEKNPFLCSFSSNIISLIKWKFSSLILLDALKAFPKVSPCSLEHHICSSSLFMDLFLFLFAPSLLTPLLLQFYFAAQSTKINLLRNSALPLVIYSLCQSCSHPHISKFPFLPKHSWNRFYNVFTSCRNPCCGKSLAFSVTHRKFFGLLSFEEGLFLPIIWFLAFFPPFCSPHSTPSGSDCALFMFCCSFFDFSSSSHQETSPPLPFHNFPLIILFIKDRLYLEIHFDFQTIYY